MSRAAPGPRSRALFRRATRSLVGGVDSPVRSFGAVGGTPVVFERGRGAYLWDVDGRRYIDLVSSWGANLLGSAPPTIVRAVRRAAGAALTLGAPCPGEAELAEKIRAAVPEIDRLRFVSSGTEATMSAIRVARGYTGRSRIVKFAGGYHGHSDGLLARAGSGLATGALPDSAGVPRSIVAETRVLPYNDLEALDRLFEREGPRIAAVLVEPVAGNMGVVPPVPGFLSRIGRWCRASGALSIADEVITGFRLRRGIIAPELGLRPDLVTLGKIVGGGLPVGAYGGRRAVMEVVAPLGPVYQAGTLSGNPVAMAAGRAMLDELRPALYRSLERTSAELEAGISEAACEARVAPLIVQRVGSMLGIFFAKGPIRTFASALTTDRRRFARFFHGMLDRGVYLPPSPLETTFVSAAIGTREIDRVVRAARESLRASATGGRG
ncbi:MAG: glutamate-1-semialdehyde 2,1-aminomutase [Thermoplasmata archaeon]